MINIDAGNIAGLTEYEVPRLNKLINLYNAHSFKNSEKDRYYEGKISLNEVNLGIALPENIRKLEIGCAWGAKCVDVLAARSMFDGFVGVNGEEIAELDAIAINNNLISEYMKACRDELKYGCTFATLSADEEIGVKIRFHSPQTAAGLWNGEKGRIDCGFAIIDSVPDEAEEFWSPSVINYYTDEYVWVLRREQGDYWTATPFPHSMGRPLIEPLIWNATSSKPFGQSRLKKSVRNKIQSYVRTVANATIGLEFSTSPQKYLLGVSDEMYDVVINQKFKQYVGSIIAATSNPETGQNPQFGQLMQGNISPHVEMMRMLATQFSSDTGLPYTDTGVINEANPTSADAILAQTQTLVGMAEQLNTGNGYSLRNIALMAQAINSGLPLDELDDNQKDIMAHFKNPAMPSVAATTDAAMKITSARPEFAATDTFLEMIGFDKASIRKIKAEESRIRGLALLAEMENEINATTETNMG